jgi:hypothetical protein
MILKGPHRKRSIRFLELREVGEWRVKLYGISATSEFPRTELVEASVAALGEHLPPGGVPNTYGMAFVIVHDAADFGIVLIDWWANENEVHQHMLSAPLSDPGSLSTHPSDGVGCVWELAVTCFERHAWLDHVLANPAGPDFEAYLAAHLNTDV